MTVLACACDDNKTHLHVEKLNKKYELSFPKLHTLIGHEDWVSGIDTVKTGVSLLSNLIPPYNILM